MTTTSTVFIIGVKREEEPPGRTEFRLLAVRAEDEVQARRLAKQHLARQPEAELTTATIANSETAERLALAPDQVWPL